MSIRVPSFLTLVTFPTRVTAEIARACALVIRPAHRAFLRVFQDYPSCSTGRTPSIGLPDRFLTSSAACATLGQLAVAHATLDMSGERPDIAGRRRAFSLCQIRSSLRNILWRRRCYSGTQRLAAPLAVAHPDQSGDAVSPLPASDYRDAHAVQRCRPPWSSQRANVHSFFSLKRGHASSKTLTCACR